MRRRSLYRRGARWRLERRFAERQARFERELVAEVANALEGQNRVIERFTAEVVRAMRR